jgi:hypothetical protein
MTGLWAQQDFLSKDSVTGQQERLTIDLGDLVL